MNISDDKPDITDEVSCLIQKLADEFTCYRLSTSDPKKSVVCIAINLGREYFLTARDALNNGYIIGGGSLVRSCFENLADIFYILKDEIRTKKYAKPYILSLEIYKQEMLRLHSIDIDQVFRERKANQVNKWSGNATISDRLADLSSPLATVYDMFSYFSHPNPASIAYLNIKGLKDAQLNLSKQINCHLAVMLMAICVTHCNANSVTYDELLILAEKIGTPIGK